MTEIYERRLRLWEVFRRLYRHFGPRHWWPAETPFEVIVGAILTQAVAWRNVEQAIGNLKAEGLLSPEALWSAPEEELHRHLRPTRYYRAKTAKLKEFLSFLHSGYGLDLERLWREETAVLREKLARVRGLGPETVDAILLYAAGRPVFVVDEYTRRIFSRLGLTPERVGYRTLQGFFMAVLPPDVPFLNEYHAQIDALGHGICRAEPRCGGCPLLDVCLFGRSAKGGSPL